VKKFLVIVAMVAAFVAWGETASAQCGNASFFGRSQFNSGGRVYHSAPVYRSASVYHSIPTYNNSGCNSTGCNTGHVVAVQPQYNEGIKRAVVPAPYNDNPAPAPAPVPQKVNQQEDILLPPKKIQPPNPFQEGFPGGVNIEGEYYGRLPSGDYAKISDGTYSRLMGNTAYGSYLK